MENPASFTPSPTPAPPIVSAHFLSPLLLSNVASLAFPAVLWIWLREVLWQLFILHMRTVRTALGCAINIWGLHRSFGQKLAGFFHRDICSYCIMAGIIGIVFRITRHRILFCIPSCKQAEQEKPVLIKMVWNNVALEKDGPTTLSPVSWRRETISSNSISCSSNFFWR